MEGIPICSLYGNGEIKGLMLYGSLDSTGYLDWDSWDIFISRLMNKKFSVRKYGNLLYSKLSYRQGFLELTDVFLKKKVICVKGIKSCTCIGNTILVNTEEYGHLRLTTKKSDKYVALAITRILSGFASGIYVNDLP